MKKPLTILAFDLGASSGRAILGRLDRGRLSTEEIHRFSNDPVNINGCLHWDILRLFFEIKQGIIKCVNAGYRDIDSIGIDTWGVDFGLLDTSDNLLGNPCHYRDRRTEGMVERVFNEISEESLYGITGIQIMRINTLFQLYAMKQSNAPHLREAKTLLLLPDLLNYFLTGIKKTEYTIASTTQLLDAERKNWSFELIRKLKLPVNIFTEIIPPATIVGSLSREMALELGTGQIPVVATASHDTKSAIVSVPAGSDDFIYISTGTWSLMGIESERPVINEESRISNFTNEGGAGNKITFLKNIMGHWILQECKREWDRSGKTTGFDELGRLASEAVPFRSYIDPDHEPFLSTGNMVEKIRRFCADTNQKIPETMGEISRCIVESLAMKYRKTADRLAMITGRSLKVVHMVGGGIKDRLLCQATASALAREVVAGPVEAAAIGNIITQAIALSAVGSIEEGREIVRNSYKTEKFYPVDQMEWNGEYERFNRIAKH
ncbi:MAG: rhamnulokinase [Oligoflexales bacterium]|nr:rhamnulokinase [Oligoflexales bacterium]